MTADNRPSFLKALLETLPSHEMHFITHLSLLGLCYGFSAWVLFLFGMLSLPLFSAFVILLQLVSLPFLPLFITSGFHSLRAYFALQVCLTAHLCNGLDFFFASMYSLHLFYPLICPPFFSQSQLSSSPSSAFLDAWTKPENDKRALLLEQQYTHAYTIPFLLYLFSCEESTFGAAIRFKTKFSSTLAQRSSFHFRLLLSTPDPLEHKEEEEEVEEASMEGPFTFPLFETAPFPSSSLSLCDLERYFLIESEKEEKEEKEEEGWSEEEKLGLATTQIEDDLNQVMQAFLEEQCRKDKRQRQLFLARMERSKRQVLVLLLIDVLKYSIDFLFNLGILVAYTYPLLDYYLPGDMTHPLHQLFLSPLFLKHASSFFHSLQLLLLPFSPFAPSLENGLDGQQEGSLSPHPLDKASFESLSKVGGLTGDLLMFCSCLLNLIAFPLLVFLWQRYNANRSRNAKEKQE